MGKFKDITGKKFGSYLVIKRVIKEDDKNTYFECSCDCGEIKIICSQHLRYGKAKQCRTCFENKHQLEGQRFGKLIVLKKGTVKIYKNRNIHQTWLCLCDCGKKTEITTSHLIDGYSKSCGCTIKYKDRSTAAFNSLFSSYRTSASSRNLEFSLTRDKFKELTLGQCHYCGEQPLQKFQRGSSIYIYNGIDRKDNSVGYVLTNTVPCCKVCNIAKHIRNEDDFVLWIKQIYQRNEIKWKEEK